MNNIEMIQLVDSVLLNHPRFDHAHSKIRQVFKAMASNIDPMCLAIIGESRTGKSRLLEHFAKEAPPKRLDDGLIVPFLRIRVPAKPTVRNLAETLLFEIGDPWYAKGTEATRTGRLRKMLKSAGTRVIALDEFQHFEDKASLKIQHQVADWLKVLVDEERIGLVVTGLPSSMRVIEQNEQFAGRFMAPIHLKRFDWSHPGDQREFIAMLVALKEALHPFEFPDLADPAVAFRLYCACGGLIGYLMKILRQATFDAIETETTKVPMQGLRIAYSNAIIPDSDPERRMPNPFSSSFDRQDEEHLMDLAGCVGMHRQPPRGKKSRFPNKNASKEIFAR